jgi:hypothetical protein
LEERERGLDKLSEREVDTEKVRMGQEDLLQRECGRPREKEGGSKSCHRRAEEERRAEEREEDEREEAGREKEGR